MESNSAPIASEKGHATEAENDIGARALKIERGQAAAPSSSCFAHLDEKKILRKASRCHASFSRCEKC